MLKYARCASVKLFKNYKVGKKITSIISTYFIDYNTAVHFTCILKNYLPEKYLPLCLSLYFQSVKTLPSSVKITIFYSNFSETLTQV